MENQFASNEKEPNSSAVDRNTKWAQKAAVIVPLFISLLFFAIEICIPAAIIFQNKGLLGLLQYTSWSVFMKVVNIFIGYFTPTLISTILFMLIQQYYFDIPAGLDTPRVVSLGKVTSVYICAYIAHISTGTKLDLVAIFLLVWTCVQIPQMWKSLEKDVREVNAGRYPFSGAGNNNK